MIDVLMWVSKNPFVASLFLMTLTSFGVAFYLGSTMLRREKKAEERLKRARADITDMTILFQTMRDIIGQQKTLAREFNEELEHKMEQVKHILSQGMDKNKQLYDKQQRIAEELGEAQARIDGIYRQLEDTRHREIPAPAPSPTPTPAPTPEPVRPIAHVETPVAPRVDDVQTEAPTPRHVPAPPPVPVARPIGNGSAATRAGKSILDTVTSPNRGKQDPRALARDLEKLSDTGVTKSSFTNWVAQDLSSEAEAPRAEAPPRAVSPEPAPTPPHPDFLDEEASPQNGDAAREAFRALLNMPQDSEARSVPFDLPGQVTSLPTVAAREPTPPTTTAVQQRVLEYSEAGMTVAEVSRELGIGKGEVRLMLSLAKQNNSANR